MKIASYDPGLTSGYVLYETEDKCVLQYNQFTNPLDVARTIYEGREDIDVLLVEAFPGGGNRTTEAIHTLQVLGFIRYFAETLGLKVVVQQPQRRIAFVKQAQQFLPNQPHACAALAHVLAYIWYDSTKGSC